MRLLIVEKITKHIKIIQKKSSLQKMTKHVFDKIIAYKINIKKSLCNNQDPLSTLFRVIKPDLHLIYQSALALFEHHYAD